MHTHRHTHRHTLTHTHTHTHTETHTLQSALSLAPSPSCPRPHLACLSALVQDVLIRPKRSQLRSRSEVTLERTYTFCNSKREWTGALLGPRASDRLEGLGEGQD